MNFKIALLNLFLFLLLVAKAQDPVLAERLGYPTNTKFLIIHADDLGVAHSQNRATVHALENSPVNSASIMVPCPWFPEIAAYAREHPKADLGLHLTLTSEWTNYKWGPVSAKDSVSSLLNKNGYFYATVDSLVRYAVPSEVEIELRNQIKKAYAFGIDVTHLDAHMGGAMATPDFLRAYIKVGKEFRLPVFLPKEIGDMGELKDNGTLDDRTVLVNHSTIGPSDYREGTDQFYRELLQDLPPGVTNLLVHLAYDDPEMRAVTTGFEDWGSAWRQADLDFFTSPECKRILKESNIVLLQWREIRDRIVRR
tara:strand:+ start:6753 stop:7682 length:930 start_codon:yes stop_codon:yes gene_type:complete